MQPFVAAFSYVITKKSASVLLWGVSSIANFQKSQFSLVAHASSPSFTDYGPKEWMSSSVTSTEELMKNTSYRSQMEVMCMQLQAQVCRTLEELDGHGKFFADKWKRAAGGGGISCVMQEGAVFEKAGVNVSSITGQLSPSAVRQMKARLKDIDENRDYAFFACGISSVIHPRNPHVPAVHFNLRYFELEHGDGRVTWWYGGGTDLTPNFLVEEDVKHFHQTLKSACDRHSKDYYSKFKKWCDGYFQITHRGESRGVGGIFFDDLDKPSQKEAFAFVKSCAGAIVPSYAPIVKRRMLQAYTDDDKQWQLLRRGRYVEFNLVYDRGTKFGLATPEARTESILMSLPLYAKWVYCHDYSNDPKKQALLDVLKHPRDWV